ncbi:hypothetical protein GCM10009738_12330 [Kitasatospora viridis]|uniref:serine/threonine-protein kinase n=1 Tax=Kitasatospora viridis TaxID=281105 RepID=UPI0031D402CF
MIGPIPLLGRLGSGGMGRVYLGTVSGRYAAVKQVLPQFVEDEDFRRHFGHELDNLARLPEKVSAPLLLADREARPPWFATAYIPGLTLNQVLAVNDGPLDAARLWLLLREASAGLAAVHALGMVHRDLKPSNVMLTVDGVSLIDFGVARAADQSRLTRTGVVLGTPAFMAPEQANGSGNLTSAADVFALGALIAYAACGRPPFGEGSGVDMLYRVVHTEPDLSALQALDPDLAELVAACLDKSPTARPTADGLVRLAGQHCSVDPPDWPEPVVAPLRARAAFAARPAPPAPDRATLHLAEPTPTVAAPRRRWGRRQRRITAIIVPLILTTGGATGLLLMPYLSPSHAAAGPAGTSPPVTTTPSAPTSTASTPPSASASGSAAAPSSSPSTSPSTSPAPPPSSAPPGTPAGTDATRTTPAARPSAGSPGTRSTAPVPPAPSPPASSANTASTPAAPPTPPLGPECVLNYNRASCSSNNPTAQLQWYHGSGDQPCTFTGNITWGDGSSSSANTPGGPAGTYSNLAAHHYPGPGTYSISVQAITDSGFCLAFGFNSTFTLTN